ncbi:HAD hydrolase-like protein [Azospirillum thermophilum]|uniref:HAD family hydrolase n=1 Tax=Azospirillum thermophilum TaxID=2202148 RepID=A0A2S2CM13_9PROT|nr:HAD hydrolase-like protein [Azospirillum thermophilum]AWK85512.1 HAD family hydrolase [Azospirillum thermophilum]
MSVRLAIFDFDGTLADSFGWFIGVLNGVAERYRFNPVRAEEVEALRGYDARRLMRHLGVPLWKLPLIARHMRGLAARDAEHIPLFDGTGEMLRALRRRGVTVAVVTSNSAENVRRILGPETAALVDHYGCGASLFGKPAKFRSVLRASGIHPRDAIAIGDEIRDIEAARQVGVRCAAVTWGYASAEALAARHPDLLLRSMEEVVEAAAGRAPDP